MSMPSDQSGSAVPKAVLVVEDNELNRKLLNDLLEYHGYTVITTASGEAALPMALASSVVVENRR